MAKKQKISLKEENPELYYRNKRKALTVGKVMCSTLPAVVVLGIYSILSLIGVSGTNPLNPLKFGIGGALAVVGIVVVLGIELKSISKGSTENNEETGVDFGKSIVWLYVATMLWLFYITVFWLIMFAIAQFIGSFIGAFIDKGIKDTNKYIEKEETASINAEAIYRVNKKHSKENNGGVAIPTE